MERSSSSLRSSIDDHVIARLSADHAREEEIVARSGDLTLDNIRDPWSTGEIEHLERKWLQQELMDRVARNESVSGRRLSLERLGSINSGRFSHSRLSYSSHHSSLDHIPLETELTRGSETLTFHPPLSEASIIPEPSTVQKQNERYEHMIEYGSTLAHLAFFGIIGVLIRYGLDVLYGDVLSITIEQTIMYRDLPPNIVGSFFMGWVGIALKKDIVDFSRPLAIGLSTGLMGSITTYASWTQKMVELFTTGHVITAFSGYLTGMLLAQISLQLGIDSAQGLKEAIANLHRKTRKDEEKDTCIENEKLTMNTFHNSIIGLAIFAFISLCLWIVALCLLVTNVGTQKQRIMFLGCVVAPPGVWARWHLARFNGQGIGTKLKWLPIGTLMANMLAASFEAIFRFLQFVATSDTSSLLLAGLQLGFMGCLSTVSTFVAEIHFMCVGRMKLKAYMYALTTLALGFVIGLLLYSTPSWASGHVVW